MNQQAQATEPIENLRYNPKDRNTENEEKRDLETIDDLTRLVLDAHGGLDRWHHFDKVAATVVSGGYLWGMKGFELGDTPRRITSDFRRQWTRVEPFGDPDWRMTYQPDRVVIEKQDGEIISEQQKPREAFDGHAWETPWTPTHLAYFNGYAMWTYYNLPFLLGDPSLEITEIPSTNQEGLRLSGLRVRFPETFHTHCSEQDLYFEESGLLRRHDYQVAVAGKFQAAHLISDYVDVEGLKFPTKRRVHPKNEDGTLRFDKTVVSIDLYDFTLS